jgi:Tol biopolymer transport system component
MKQFPITYSALGLAAILGIGVAAGCVVVREQPGEPVMVSPLADDQPVLPNAQRRSLVAAARDQQVNPFGEMPGRASVPYFTRTAASLVRHTFADDGAEFDPCISPDGQSFVFASTRHNVKPDLYHKQIDGVAVTQLTADPASDIQPAYSPNGRRVAFASDRSGNWDIWIVGLDGTQPVQMTSSASDEIHPSWSPDGTKIVYCSLPPQGQWELWIADATSGGGHKRFIGYGLFPEWSPAGDTIVYQRARERGSRHFSIWTMQLLDGEPRYPTEVAATAGMALISPSWSRDGAKIAFTTVPPAATSLAPGATPKFADIWVVNANGRNRVRLTDGHTANFGPTWSPMNRVFFTSGREGQDAIWSLSPDMDATGQAPASASGNEASRTARTASDR